MWNSKPFTSLCCPVERKFRAQNQTVPANGHLKLIQHALMIWRASSELYNPFLPPRLPRIYNFILTTLVHWYYAYLFSFTLICCILSECMLVQNNLVKLNYVERGLLRICGGHGELPHEILWRNLIELCELRRYPIISPVARGARGPNSMWWHHNL